TKNRIYIGRGSNDNVKKGKAGLASKTVLVGIVQDVSSSRSEILTAFDTSFVLPVRIGDKEVDALLQGGISPRLTLIDRASAIASGDKIISASKDLPYGLEIGTVENVSQDASGAFFAA